MNKWGIPNWRDASAYEDANRWSYYRWRWEFLRRRDDLRKCFELLASLEAPDPGPSYKSRPPRGQPGFYVRGSRETIGWKLGYRKLPDPTISNHPETLLFAIDDHFPPFFDEMVQTEEGFAAYDVPLHADNSAIFVFDLDKPLEAQIKTATRAMRRSQKHLHGKLLQKRRHPKKWLGYLRTLDAREDGATWAEIATLHRNTAQTEQTARDIWEAAHELRFNF